MKIMKKIKTFTVSLIKIADKRDGVIEEMAPRQDFEDIVILFNFEKPNDIKIGTRKYALTRHTEAELSRAIEKAIIPNIGLIIQTEIGNRKIMGFDDLELNIYSTAKDPYKP